MRPSSAARRIASRSSSGRRSRREATTASTVVGTLIASSRRTQREALRRIAGVGREDAALDQRLEDLVDEERIAAGAIEDLAHERARVGGVVEAAGDQLLALALAQLTDEDRW